MKILFISNSDDKYGAPRSLLDMVVNLKKTYDITPIILTPKYNDINKKCDELNIENYSFKYYSFMFLKSKSIGKNVVKFPVKAMLYRPINKITSIKIEKKIDFNSIDIIHSNISVIDIGVQLSKKHNIPHVWHLREFGQEDFNLKTMKFNYIEYMNKNTSLFFAISNAVKLSWEKKGINSDKIHVVYNGVKTAKFNKTNLRSHKNKVLKIVFSGSIVEHKGQEQLIEAMKKLSPEISSHIQIDFIGKGVPTYEKYLKNKVENYGMKNNINFVGYRNNIEKLLSDYDLGIVCSKSEGFGRVTVEYMIAELGIIASNTGANEEIIEDNVNGLIYKYSDPQDLANKIEFFFYNREAILKLGKSAGEKARKKFTSELNAKNIYLEYIKIVQS